MFDPNLKAKILNNYPVLGIWNTLNSVNLTNLLASAGFDFQIIDFEHGVIDYSMISSHVFASSSYSCSPLFRIPSLNPESILQILDQGGSGIVVPHVENSTQIFDLHRYMSYPPEGIRGFSPYTPACSFNKSNADLHINISNTNLVSVCIIESLAGVANLPTLLEQNLADVFYFGAYDLSVELGIPGQLRSHILIDTIKQSVDLVNSFGSMAGGFVPKSQSEIDELISFGIRFITYNVDTSILYDNVSPICSSFKKIS